MVFPYLNSVANLSALYDAKHQTAFLESVSLPASTATFAAAFMPLRPAAVAFHAILEIRNAFPNMLGSNAVRLVLVAAVAGVFASVVVDVTDRAVRVVVAIEHKELGVVERGRLPAFGAVTFGAASGEIAMDGSLRRHVARGAFLAGRGWK
jgi:hypothetical protein